jgi:hypothetical protein
MTFNQKITQLQNTFSTFDKEILKKPLSRVRFSIASFKIAEDSLTFEVKNTDEINEIITEFNKKVGLKPLDFIIEDVRLLKDSKGFMFINLIDIQIIN